MILPRILYCAQGTLLVGFFDARKALQILRMLVEHVDSLPLGEGHPIFTFETSCMKDYLATAEALILKGHSYEGQVIEFGMNELTSVPVNFYSKPTTSGRHIISWIKLDEFTERDYYEDKYAIVVGTHTPNDYNFALEAFTISQASYAASGFSSYFAGIVGRRKIPKSLDRPIDDYLGHYSVIQRKKLPDNLEAICNSLELYQWEYINERSVLIRIGAPGEFVNYARYKNVCDALGMLCMGDL